MSENTETTQITFPAECECGTQMTVRYCRCGCGQYSVVEGDHECEFRTHSVGEAEQKGDEPVTDVEDSPLTGVYYDPEKDFCEECGLKRYSECDCARRKFIEATGYHPDVADVMIETFGIYF